jgi:hypothetical protein
MMLSHGLRRMGTFRGRSFVNPARWAEVWRFAVPLLLLGAFVAGAENQPSVAEGQPPVSSREAKAPTSVPAPESRAAGPADESEVRSAMKERLKAEAE